METMQRDCMGMALALYTTRRRVANEHAKMKAAEVNMNHGKTRSYSETQPEVCRVPFSWEEKPGIPKFNPNPNQTYAEKPEEVIRETTNALLIQAPLRKSTSFEVHSPLNAVIYWGYSYTTNMKLSPPPIRRARQLVPCKTSPRKGFWRQQQDDDPFAAAIKKCTKGIITVQGMGPNGGRHQNCIQPYKGKTQKVHNFSCKKSFEVKGENLVRLVNCIIPSLPKGKKERDRAR